MKMFKSFIVSLAVISTLIGFSLKSSAAGTAVVDMNKIRETYSLAQQLTADKKVKEKELQKFIETGKKQLLNAKTAQEKKTLQDSLNQQLNTKRNALVKDQNQKWSKLEKTVMNCIKEIAVSGKYDMVLSKQVVFYGGYDITDEVLAKLKAQAVNP
ncbi:MAG TPA: OmpH family outer membrane protein [Candidatus Gastranaerophilales bacterium]|nr:OmpH family outer membrane protein [Candidatus Gastranaerophilales bacterium]